MLDDQAMHDLEQSWVPAIQGKIEKDEIDEDYMEIARFHYKGYNYYLVASLFPHLDEDSAYVTYSIETDRMNPILEGDQDTDLFRNDIADIPDDIRTVDDLAECFRKQAEIEKRSLPDTIDEYVKNGRII